ncbi:hypothetical protein MTBBW1_260015 [Desulfamplus magnetovallimortis]|uniref:Uncharacterized protein n=1 Tax=Desulfamplus magnetovallimortis TaxID=1246637 RepID=A0A1W1HET9_9BACT|nr:hypothetical protein MTBBW1_260015 [Desulfamplus magnetovallimortis]
MDDGTTEYTESHGKGEMSFSVPSVLFVVKKNSAFSTQHS